MRRMIGWAVVVGLVVMVVPDARAISPYGILNKLRQVDGAGSGLDADTVQGLTPADIAGAAGAGVGTAIGAFLNSAYTLTNPTTVDSGFCGCIQQACNGTDFLFNCGGASTLTTGYLTTVHQVPGFAVCEACACGNGGATALAVTASCLVR